MRVAIMLDKTIKSTQMAALEEHKKRLRRAEDLFERLVDKERQRIQEEEAEKWRPRLAAAKEKMAKQLQLQQEQMKKKIAQVREALGQRYQEGFDPLLREAEARYAEEAQASERLRQEIARKEQLLRNAEKEMRRLEEDVMSPQKESGASTQHSKEMDKLNMELRNLWVELKSDPDEVATFLSELDAISPYSDAVLKLYEAAEAELGKMES
jgi:chromosome segregation ATPase